MKRLGWIAILGLVGAANAGPIALGPAASTPSDRVRPAGVDSLHTADSTAVPGAASRAPAGLSLPGSPLPGAGSLVLDSLVPPDSLLDLEAALAHLEAARRRLAGPERSVFEEIVAAARELYAIGDAEAARLLVQDGIELLREESP